jgi:pimeloyl-ACP methyl ester carboxylesterase
MWISLLVALGTSPDTLRIAVAPAETLQVSVSGEGPPVVLIPGVVGSAFGFRKLTSRLVATGFRTVVIEPLGFGLSTRPDHAQYSLGSQADRVAAVLDSLRLRDAIVVAHSLGGSIAFRVGYRRADLVRAIVSLEGGPAESARATGLRSAGRLKFLIKLVGGGAARHRFREGLIKASGDPSWVTDSVVAGYTTALGGNLGLILKAVDRMVAAVEAEPLEARLADVRCPVHLVIGLAPHPETLPEQVIALLRDRLRSFTLDSIAGVGHHLHEERADLVADLIARVHESSPPSAVVTAADRPSRP